MGKTQALETGLSMLWKVPKGKINPETLRYVPKESNKFLVKDSQFSLLSQNGEELSSIFYMKDKECIDILDIVSNKSGCGYGTTLLQKFLSTFKDSKIRLAACWEKFISPLPPHKFYMQNGFVPTDQKAAQALKEWISKGGNPKDFPNKYELCEMVRIPT